MDSIIVQRNITCAVGWLGQSLVILEGSRDKSQKLHQNRYEGTKVLYFPARRELVHPYLPDRSLWNARRSIDANMR